MSERSLEEYWMMVGYRDYWADELASLSTLAATLEERVTALSNAISGMRLQEGNLGEILSGVSQVPSVCGLWQGARAKEFFAQCSEGSLYTVYRGALDAASTMIRELEAALRELRTRLDEAYAGRREADRNYALWDQKVAYYWY